MRAALVVFALSLSTVVHAQTNEESEAGDVSEVDKDSVGPLRERVRPVSGHVFLKKGRFEVSPGVTVSLNDAFYTKYLIGASLTYHLAESFAIGLRGGYAFSKVSGAAQVCEPGKPCTEPTKEDLDGRGLGNISLLGGLDLQWAPVYGKISLVAESFLSFDLYLIAGGTAVQYIGPSPNGGTGGQSYLTFGGNVGLGARFFINRFMTVRTELRDVIYSETAVPVNSLRNQLLFELGLSFFFPTAFEEG